MQRSTPQAGRRDLAVGRAAAALVAALTFCAGLLSAQSPPELSTSAALQIDVLRSIKAAKTAMQSKIDSRLFLGLLHLRDDARLAPLTDFRFVRPAADGRIPVDIVVADASGVKAVADELEKLDAVPQDLSYAYRRVSARVHLEDLETLAAMPAVRKIRQPMPARTQGGSNVSEGDKTHGVDQARNQFGVHGFGTKVCVLSDGVDSLAALQASGDLPAVDVLPGEAGSGDAGSAMLEIVHDLAPGASLGFATAVASQASFAQNILDLAAAGCDILVDDATYPDESPFEDGPLAQAVDTVTATGVLYFSAAGDEGNADDLTAGTWEGDFLASAAAVVRQKPDITAADGVATAAPGFTAATPAQIRTALINSALDVEAAGVDRDTGAGIVMAQAALLAVGAVPQAFLTAGAAVPAQLLGDGDAFVENDETWSLTIPLTNTGGANATALSAVLTSPTPGITIGSGSSAYPGLAPASSGNNTTPYSFFVGAAVPCGGRIDFLLTVTYAGGPSSQSLDFSIKTGSPGTPVTFSYTGPAVPIPDAADLSGTLPGAPAVGSLPVAGVAGNVYDVDFSIDGAACSATAGSTTVGIDHTFVSDLELTLLSPSGTSILVVDNTDGPGNNFCQTALDDESAGIDIQSVVAASAPFTGSFTPQAALSGFDGEAPNGSWQLQAQDFFNLDTGNVRAFSVAITPAVCNAPPRPDVTGTMTVSGNFVPDGIVTYTVTLNNNGNAPQPDNPTDEFVADLPSCLTLVSAEASSGTLYTAPGVVGWNGSIPRATSPSILSANTRPILLKITIKLPPARRPGTISRDEMACPCGLISMHGTISFDADANGTNETSRAIDDSVTTFTLPAITATMTASGNFTPGGVITYPVVLTNSGCRAQNDNPGDELTDVLPAGLTLLGVTATSGTTTTTPPPSPGSPLQPTSKVTWNGSIPAHGGMVTVTITAAVSGDIGGRTISNQGRCSFDSDGDDTNDATCVTDDPNAPGSADPTSVTIAQSPAGIPALSGIGLALLCLVLAGAALLLLRRRPAG